MVHQKSEHSPDTWITHTVSMVTVGLKLHEDRTLIAHAKTDTINKEMPTNKATFTARYNIKILAHLA